MIYVHNRSLSLEALGRGHSGHAWMLRRVVTGSEGAWALIGLSRRTHAARSRNEWPLAEPSRGVLAPHTGTLNPASPGVTIREQRDLSRAQGNNGAWLGRHLGLVTDGGLLPSICHLPHASSEPGTNLPTLTSHAGEQGEIVGGAAFSAVGVLGHPYLCTEVRRPL